MPVIGRRATRAGGAGTSARSRSIWVASQLERPPGEGHLQHRVVGWDVDHHGVVTQLAPTRQQRVERLGCVGRRQVEAEEQQPTSTQARPRRTDGDALALHQPGRLLPVAGDGDDLDHAGATVTGTPLRAALPERSSRSGSVRSLIDTPGTLLARASRTPSAWCP